VRMLSPRPLGIDALDGQLPVGHPPVRSGASLELSDVRRAEIDAGPGRSVDNLPHSFALRGNSRGDGIIADAAARSQREARAHRRLAALEG